MRHDECSGVDVMESDTSKKYSVHYVQQELPKRLFAIIRMAWRSEDGIDIVDEAKLIDEGADTIAGFAELMQKAIEGGAEISIICPYDPEDIGLY
tara:strand:+ start:283 stop:567 length:285 start_codon:yes stop_codon:yes gene_type:complete